MDRKSGSWSGSMLVAYKLDWQSVVFLGYDSPGLAPSHPCGTLHRDAGNPFRGRLGTGP
jgi:hypothetical protein